MKQQNTILDRILQQTKIDLQRDKQKRPLAQLKAMLPDAPPHRSLVTALENKFGLIAEIKEKSPSKGNMRAENVIAATDAYENSSAVLALSVLTNLPYFGMTINRLQEIKNKTTKPILRKDFIIDPYQIYEAKAFGADVILLMAQRLTKEKLKNLHDLADELQLEVLMEYREKEQLPKIPPQTKIIGMNSRQLLDSGEAFERSKAEKSTIDFSTDLNVFKQIHTLPSGTLKIAESGVHPHNIISNVRDLGYNAALVGTSLLLNPRGIHASLSDFEKALNTL